MQDELARVRTRLDIAELEKKMDVVPGFLESQDIGESSGQARQMSAEAEETADLTEEKEHGPGEATG